MPSFPSKMISSIQTKSDEKVLYFEVKSLEQNNSKYSFMISKLSFTSILNGRIRSCSGEVNFLF